jgi:hypothetical protein
MTALRKGDYLSLALKGSYKTEYISAVPFLGENVYTIPELPESGGRCQIFPSELLNFQATPFVYDKSVLPYRLYAHRFELEKFAIWTPCKIATVFPDAEEHWPLYLLTHRRHTYGRGLDFLCTSLLNALLSIVRLNLDPLETGSSLCTT